MRAEKAQDHLDLMPSQSHDIFVMHTRDFFKLATNVNWLNYIDLY